MDRPRLCVDFDGTIYTGVGLNPGCVEALTRLRQTYRIAIYSARLTDTERQQMKEFLDANQVPYDEILLPKPDADFYIDDKGVRFTSWEKVLCDFS